MSETHFHSLQKDKPSYFEGMELALFVAVINPTLRFSSLAQHTHLRRRISALLALSLVCSLTLLMFVLVLPVPQGIKAGLLFGAMAWLINLVAVVVTEDRTRLCSRDKVRELLTQQPDSDAARYARDCMARVNFMTVQDMKECAALKRAQDARTAAAATETAIQAALASVTPVLDKTI